MIEREKIRLRSKYVRPVTKDMFPVNIPILIEAIIDTRSGWDFDAPLHIMRPFHRYCETGSISAGVLEDKIEDVMIDLDTGREVPPDDHAWPYSGEYLKRVFRSVQRGERLDRFLYIRATVTVKSWAEDDDGCVDYDFKLFNSES